MVVALFFTQLPGRHSSDEKTGGASAEFLSPRTFGAIIPSSQSGWRLGKARRSFVM